MSITYTLAGDLVQYLKGIPNIFALCADRIFPLAIDETLPRPAIAYELGVAGRIMATDGGTILFQSPLTITCVSESYDKALQLAAEVRDALVTFKGMMGGTFVSLVNYEGSTPDFDEDVKVFLIILSLTLTHK